MTVCLLGALLWTNLENNQTAPEIKTDNLFPKAHNFSYKSLNGRAGQLYDHKEHVVLLHFWATWCAPCIEELPDLIELAANNPKNLKVLAVSSDMSDKDIDIFLKKLDIDMPANFIVIRDNKKKITKDLYGTTKLPETYLISPTLKVREKITGPQENWASEQWRRKIEALHNME